MMSATGKQQRFDVLDDMANVSRKIRTLFDARVREKGLTLARARTLLRVQRGEAANQKELAVELEIETATLVRLIDGLEAQGLIERHEVEGDRRAKQVVLTEAGEAMFEKLRLAAVAFDKRLRAGLDEARLAEFAEVLAGLRANVEG